MDICLECKTDLAFGHPSLHFTLLEMTKKQPYKEAFDKNVT